MSGLTGDWGKIENILSPSKLRASLKRATAKAGVFGESEVRRGIHGDNGGCSGCDWRGNTCEYYERGSDEKVAWFQRMEDLILDNWE